MSIVIRPCIIAEIEQATELVAEYSSYAIESMPKVVVQWEKYKQLESAGMITVFGADSPEGLVGFAVVVEQVSLHYGTPMTITESFFVSKAYRKTGAGTKLLNFIKHHAKEVGSVGLVVVAPIDKELCHLLHLTGYAPTHKVFHRSL